MPVNYNHFGICTHIDLSEQGQFSCTHAADISLTKVSTQQYASKVSMLHLQPFKRSSFNAAGYELISRTFSKGEYIYEFKYVLDGEYASFLIPHTGKNVTVACSNNISDDQILFLFWGPTFKFCLQLLQAFFLHASAVRINNKIILFIGPSGVGKSTITAYFHLQGYEIWNDDVSVLELQNDRFMVYKGETSVKVLQDTVRQLSLPESGIRPHIRKPGQPADKLYDDDKFLFSISEGIEPGSDPLPLHTIYFLGKRVKNPAAIISVKNKTDDYVMLAKELLQAGLASETTRKNYLNNLGSLLSRVPVKHITAPNDISRISEVLDAVKEDLAHANS